MKCVVLVGVVATLSGCSFPEPPRAGQEDPDAPTSGADGQQGDAGRLDGAPCTPGYINLCNVTARTDLFTPTTSATINTSTDARCIVKAQTNGPELCILYFSRVDIPTSVTVTVTGARALVLASTTTLNIAGTLDVGAPARIAVPPRITAPAPSARRPRTIRAAGAAARAAASPPRAALAAPAIRTMTTSKAAAPRVARRAPRSSASLRCCAADALGSGPATAWGRAAVWAGPRGARSISSPKQPSPSPVACRRRGPEAPAPRPATAAVAPARAAPS